MLGLKRQIELVRELVSDAIPGDQITDDVITDLLSQSINQIIAKAAQETPFLFLKSRSITSVADQELYRWNSFAERIVSLERTDKSPREPRYPVPFRDRHLYLQGSTTTANENYYIQGTRIGVVPAPTGTSETRKIWWQGCPPALHYGTAQTGGNTSITLATTATRGTVSVADDHYNEMPIYIESGIGIGQSNIITAYAGSTKVATVGFTWATNPDSTSVYSLCPPIPEAFHMLPVLRVSSLALSSMETPNQIIENQANALEQSFLAYCGVTDEELPEMIIETGWD